jgi:hypothetical protein
MDVQIHQKFTAAEFFTITTDTLMWQSKFHLSLSVPFCLQVAQITSVEVIFLW